MNLDNIQYVPEVDHTTKEYSGNQVLKGINLHIKSGEIHVLTGEDGVGKSTLMNVLFGMPVVHFIGGFGGSVKTAGQPVNTDTPLKAMELEIGMIHQEFMLIPDFTVTEDIEIGCEISTPNLVSRIFGKSMENLDAEVTAKDTRKVFKTIGLQIEDYVRITDLPVGYMRFIEITREVDKTGIRLLVFDEPTAVLTESEAGRLLEATRVIAPQEIAVTFITHRLDEVMAAVDSMTTLRDGEFATHREIRDTNVVGITELMIGRKVEELIDTSEEDRRIIDNTNIAVSMKDYYVDMPGKQIKGTNLDIRKGEIFGTEGLVGRGKLGIPNGIIGLCKAEGQVMINGGSPNLRKLGCALECRIAFISEDRKGIGLSLSENIEHNIIFSTMQTNNKFFKKVLWMRFLGGKIAREHAQDMVKRLDIRCTGIRQATGSLSGGNQQKICLARVLTLEPDTLFVSEPTRGIDIDAKKLVLEYLSKLSREQGVTVITVPSKLMELRSISDRIVTISDRKLSRILSPDAPDAESGLAMSDIKAKGGENYE